MSSYPIPKNEKRRLQVLYDYDILDTLSEHEYDCITKIAAQICNVPVSLITFLDKDRQWFKSQLGIGMQEMPREIAFCNYTIMDPANVLVVPDLRLDDRFSKNPLVTHAPNAVFYAGAPLITPEGYMLGSICVLDAKANDLNDDQRDALKGLAQQVITRLELQKNIKYLNYAHQKLKNANKSLSNFAHVVSHDMKTPLANILLVNKASKIHSGARFDDTAHEFFDLIDRSAKELLYFIEDVLIKSAATSKKQKPGKKIDSLAVIYKVIDIIALPLDIEIKVTGKFPKVSINKTSFQQIFQNLITNAIKYNDKEKGIININCRSDNAFHYFNVIDNGSGIEKKHLNKIFKERHTLNKTDRFGNKGTGIGLATVKSILETIGGTIKVTSEKNTGSIFKIGIPNSPDLLYFA